MQLPFVSIDIEPTNRCNAKCYFCPRDQTPHQGLMAPDTFSQALARAVEFRSFARQELHKDIDVSLCGLGEPLLNKHTPEFVAAVKAEGLRCGMASNGSLLDERTGERLLEAGLDRISINVGERGEDYESIYQLPWERTRDNVVRFREMAGDRCEVQVILVDHRRDREHTAEVQQYWEALGLDSFFTFGLMNRGGALFVDDMQYEEFDEIGAARALLLDRRDDAVVCHAPFVFLFIGYDGQYYLCCSDWKKEAPLGSVFDRSFTDVAAAKLAHVSSREPVCRTCNFDPVNRVAEELRAIRNGSASESDLQEVLIDVLEDDDVVGEFLSAAGVERAIALSTRRRTIPVRSA